jgi:hypothetical protein
MIKLRQKLVGKGRIAGHWWLTSIIPATQEAEIRRPYLKKNLHKNRAGGVAQGEGPEFKPQY